LLAYVLYDLVEFSTWMAIVLFAYDRGGASLAGPVAVIQLLPAAALAPPLASIGDRLSRGTALLVAHSCVALATLATAVAIVVDAPLVVVIVGSTAATTAISVVRPIHFAALPHLARGGQELTSANAFSSVADALGAFLGPVLAGVGVAWQGPGLVFVIASMVAVASALLCVHLRLSPRTQPVEHSAEGWRAAVGGLRALHRDWGSLSLLLVLANGFVLAGALDVLGVALAEQVLHGGASSAGLVVGAMGVGGLVGAGLATSFSHRRRLAPGLVAAGLVQGLAFAVVAVLGNLAVVMLAIAVSGASGALLMVLGRRLLLRATDDQVLARVFAVQEGTTLLGLAIGALTVPVLIDWLSPAGAFAPLGIVAALVAGSGWFFVRKLDARAIYLPAERALLSRTPFLAVLPGYELERLAQRASWLDVSAGTEVIRQGEAGDRFFAVAEGELAVTVDGQARPDPLRVGDSFGEIALLRSVRRTATVAAVTEARLLSVQSEDFLAAVTGSEDGHPLAEEITAAHEARDRSLRVQS
jgi:MFS family permease